ncbi:uncharacterized protein K02A2.6-like [Eupeodes corollae]|uniref:uncharacterized protein K02A2.6-like n=1 Tax=Eupeodes corollae TaxID=290404 RepID=UPI00248F73B9|nr:uncharacterized protein K02A2.6-like [Eupeodes corollae]
MRQSFWWPGSSKEMEEFVRTCTTCLQYLVPRHEPLISSTLPERPWHTIAMDLCVCYGKTFLVISDYFSRFPAIVQLENQTSRCIIKHLKSIFARFGIPEIVRTDNGPQFATVQSSEFRQFAQCWGFKHITSSPHFAQSNRFIVSAVKIVKNLLKKNTEDPQLALLEYRATPLANGSSPAELLMGRKIRSIMPMTNDRFEPNKVDMDKITKNEEQRRQQQANN